MKPFQAFALCLVHSLLHLQVTYLGNHRVGNQKGSVDRVWIATSQVVKLKRLVQIHLL